MWCRGEFAPAYLAAASLMAALFSCLVLPSARADQMIPGGTFVLKLTVPADKVLPAIRDIAAKHTGKAVAKGTKKGVHKAASATEKGAGKVKEKTEQ